MAMKRLAVAAMLLAAGCGSGRAAGRGAAYAAGASTHGVYVAIVPPARELPFDPSNARLLQASRELADIAGHPVTLEIDAALVPQGRSSLEHELVRSIEHAARDLAAFKKERPRAFATIAASLDAIACRYRATVREPQARFDPGERRVIVTQTAPGSSLVPPGLLRAALEDAFEAELARRYAAKMPDEVPPAERAAYFEHLTQTRPGYGNLSERRARKARGELPELDALATDPHAETILRVARLGEILGASTDALAAAVREWLVGEAAYFAHAYDTRAEVIARLAPSSPWRRAEAAWVRWLNAHLASLSDAGRVAIARAAFPSRGRCREPDPCPDQPASMPGFDRIAFGLAVVDEWRAGGHRTEGEGERFELHDGIVCPHTTREDGRRTRNRGCNAAFYRIAMATQATRARLVSELARRGDPRVVDEVFANAELVPSDRVVAVWRGLEPHPSLWQAAARVVVEHLLEEREHADAIVAEANRLWRDAPQRRGTALLILAHGTRGMDRSYSDPRWADFPKRYGEPVSQKALSSFLDHGARAMQLVPSIWPALGKDYSRAEPIVARLDAFVADSGVRRGSGGEPTATLRAIAGRMCDENAAGELARLHTWLEQRVRSHPGEAAALSTLVADTAGCKGRKGER
jgi:hypothetical protein